MTNHQADSVLEKLQAILERKASEISETPNDMVRKILDHENAVQFDEKRYEASNYIRGLVVEQLDGEESGNGL